MAQKSFPWSGIVTGDCGPYIDDRFAHILEILFTGGNKTTQGVLRGYLSELAVTSASSPVNVAAGAGVVDGEIFELDAATTVTIPTPSGATRIDRLVLRKDFTAQTVRLTRIAGIEGGAAPAISQVDGTTWDVKICQLSITTGGVITITDERAFCQFSSIGYNAIPSIVEGRLTVVSGDPTPSADQTAKTAVLYTPFIGDRITLWNSTRQLWETIQFTEQSVNVPANTATPFDIFGFLNAGVLNIEALAWTNDTTRATAVTRQDGRWCKSGDKTRLLLGTGRTTGVSGQIEFSKAKRYLSNVYNRTPVRAQGIFPAADYTVGGSQGLRACNSNTTEGQMRIGFVACLADVAWQADLFIRLTAAASDSRNTFGIGLTAISNHGVRYCGAVTSLPLSDSDYVAAVGYNWLQALEASGSGGGMTVDGDISGGLDLGINAILWL